MSHCERCEDGSWECGEEEGRCAGGGSGIEWEDLGEITLPLGRNREYAVKIEGHGYRDEDGNCKAKVRLTPCERPAVCVCPPSRANHPTNFPTSPPCC